MGMIQALRRCNESQNPCWGAAGLLGGGIVERGCAGSLDGSAAMAGLLRLRRRCDILSRISAVR
jgi:hypothetical protein